MAALEDRTHGTCFGEVYYTGPYLFDETDYGSDLVSFGGSLWFYQDQLDNHLLINT